MSFSYLNSPEINVASGSSIMGLESPNIPSDSSYSRQDDDMYLSDLGSPDQTTIMQKPFSLLARAETDISTPVRKAPSGIEEKEDPCQGEHEAPAANDQETAEEKRMQAAKQREEKLQSDIFILKKLNASFELFNEALQDTGSANERVAVQLEQTDALLNKYIGILSKSEEFSRLIFDDQWEGAEADEERLEQEVQAEQERRRREAEEAKLALARLEQQRLDDLKRQEKERLDREKSERAIRGGIRGVRGTRVSTRGTRGGSTSSRSGS
ncbi:hypothetical protein JR316_0002283 [Psilocybe cubensis]|uniref:Uncharacterized protein n=2 Tax=Psilocybe cubensis TaxID=181762 RepID=A0ACB8HE07_PSICU|nr:hypothetical protein JR316_0002283 [Psilocybe cubensis]KAH9485375.1 hypothetical protein JR316_0002283 [Psilocybe cubensis]